jgi:Asp-tRNA(Asn)/Glu-tRNA(Gln) amidotransferase A subunit family amidase
LIRSGQASPVDVLEAHLETIERINPIVNAIITLAAEQAWEAASEAEKAVSRGETISVPCTACRVVFKDITETAGLSSTYAATLHIDNVPTEDAEDAALMLDAMAGLSPLLPISVAPPWESALIEVERNDDALGLLVGHLRHRRRSRGRSGVSRRRRTVWLGWCRGRGDYVRRLRRPCRLHHPARGLPLSLQIIAPRFAEPRILALAKLVQRANPIGWPPIA